MIAVEEIERVAAVEHPDPHRVLGAHEEDGGVVIRAFRPDAVEILVHRDDRAGGPTPMRRIHEAGVFEATFADVKQVFPYRLEIRYASQSVVLRDPYAFMPVLGELDLYLMGEGTHREAYRYLGAHVRAMNGQQGTSFAVWAPAAKRVSIVGDFNGWDGRLHAMRRMGQGVWELFLPDIGEGAVYKYEIKTEHGLVALKTDPYAFAMELRPNNASRVVARHHVFRDEAWIARRAEHNGPHAPFAIYEVHLGSWRIRGTNREGGPITDAAQRWLTYRELADALVDHVADMGFTHIELLPIMEHPFDGSWGYQVSGFYAPTSRFGDPDDLRYFVDRCHARGIGVILDWTPAHFPKDAWALGRFDGTALYEHLDPRQGEHRQWGTYVFNYGRPEVKNFLIANALYWIDEFHIDGLRVDAVASMLYLDYGASHPGEWVPNKFGGRENLEAIAFLRELCDVVHEKFPGAVVCAEESTAWPGVTRPTYTGGLGFDLKWNMGWMHDTLSYFSMDSIFRAFHHQKLTFGMWYAYSERYLLPLSHDEVVHLKKSLLSKMPGDRWKMHANLRLLFSYMWAHPGKKLLFMGGEIGQYREWNFDAELDWFLLDEPDHRGLAQLVRDINALYKKYGALHQLDDHPDGFRWIDPNDAMQSVLSFVRYPLGDAGAERKKELSDQEKLSHETGVHVVFVGNCTPLPRHGYRVGVPRRRRYLEVLNTDASVYGGSGIGNMGSVECQPVPSHGFEQSIVLTLPPLGGLWLVPEPSEEDEDVDPQVAARGERSGSA